MIKKLNKKGWGMNDFIFLLAALTFCLIVVVILINKLNKRYNEGMDNQIIGDDKYSLKTYIEIEDEMVLAAKKYKINTEDTVVIKLSKLIENEYIKNIVDPENNKECSGYIIYSSDKKEYKAYLNCSGNYQTSNYNKDFE